jgi:hypothetical protein
MLAMKAVTPNAARVLPTTSILLTFCILGSITTFPARLRIVILERKQPQPQSDKQADEPNQRGDGTKALCPHGHADGAKKMDNNVKEDRSETEQQAKLKELDVGTKQVPRVVHGETVVDTDMPGGGITNVPGDRAFGKAKIGLGLVVLWFTGVRRGVMGSRPTAALSAPPKDLVVDSLGVRCPIRRGDAFPIRDPAVSALLARLRAFLRPVVRFSTVMTRASLRSAACFLDEGEDFSLSAGPDCGGRGPLSSFMNHSHDFRLSTTPDLAFCDGSTAPGWGGLGAGQVLGRRPFSTIELHPTSLSSDRIDVLVVQLLCDHVAVCLGLVHAADSQELTLEFGLQSTERELVILVIRPSSSETDLQHGESEVVLALSSVGELQSSSAKVNSQCLQVLSRMLLWPAILDLRFEGFEAFDDFNLDLVH